VTASSAGTPAVTAIDPRTLLDRPDRLEDPDRRARPATGPLTFRDPGGGALPVRGQAAPKHRAP